MNTYIARTIAAMLVAFAAATPAHATDAPDALLARAKITEAQARQIALAKVPNATIQSVELEREHGRLIWSLDLSIPTSRDVTELQVDALTGKIASIKTETPPDQAKETAADKKAPPSAGRRSRRIQTIGTSKEDTPRKILVRRLLDNALTREDDRALFELPPKLAAPP